MTVLLSQADAAAQAFPPTIQLPDFGGEQATAIEGTYEGFGTGAVVSDAGDLNGDGFADLLVTAAGATVGGMGQAGAGYVLFGASGMEQTPLVDLATLDGVSGFVMEGLDSGDFTGWSGASAGDVNADGLDDLLLAAWGGSVAPGNSRGVVYVIFGSPTVGAGGALDLSSLDGNIGFAIEGADFGDYLGTSVSGGGDLNGDGIDDLVLGAPAVGEPALVYDVSPTEVFSVSGADFDLDGNLDLLSVSEGGQHFTVQYNDGAGTFTPVEHDLWGFPREVIAADFNNDGWPDLVATTRNNTIGQISLVLNLGGGAFAPQQTFDLGEATMNMAVGDLDGDGFPDVVVSSYDAVSNATVGEFYVLINDQSGSFLAPAARATKAHPRLLRLADMDGDLDLDLVLYVASQDRIKVWTNDGTGTFPTKSGTDIPLTGLTAFAVGDLDGDSDIDVLGVNSTHFKWFHNDGTGALTASWATVLKTAGNSIELADLDGDLDLDVLVGTAGNSTGLTVLKNLGGGGLSTYQRFTAPADSFWDMFLGDINGDLKLDVFATMRELPNGAGGDVGILYGNGDTTFRGDRAGAVYVIFGGTTVGGTGYLSVRDLDGANGLTLVGHAGGDDLGESVAVIGDFNDDGTADLAVGAPGSHNGAAGAGSVYVLFGSSALGTPASVELEGLPSSQAMALRGSEEEQALGGRTAGGGDFDGDGVPDLVLSAPAPLANGGNTPGVAFLLRGSSLHGTGNSIDLGGLDGTTGFRVEGQQADDVLGISLSLRSDINGDGRDDWLVGASGYDTTEADAGRALIIFGQAGNLFGGHLDPEDLDGANGFTVQGEHATAYLGRSVSGLLDLNGDGVQDYILGESGADYASAQYEGRAFVFYGRNPSSAVTYCTAGSTANGCTALMSATGIASVSEASGFTLETASVDGQRQGILFWGSATKASPWGAGSSWLCVAAPTVRTGLQSSSGTLAHCDGAFTLDFNEWMASNPGKAPGPGVTVYAQAWFRDPLSAKNTSLSDGLGFLVMP